MQLPVSKWINEAFNIIVIIRVNCSVIAVKPVSCCSLHKCNVIKYKLEETGIK